MNNELKTAGIVKLYLGAKFVTGAYGPDVFDCYGLLWWLNYAHNDRTLPRFDDMDYQRARINAKIAGECMTEDWQQVTDPESFDAVVLQRNSSEAYHVGVYLSDQHKVLHAMPGHGVVCTDLPALERMGFRKVEFYRYASN